MNFKFKYTVNSELMKLDFSAFIRDVAHEVYTHYWEFEKYLMN